MLGILLKSKLAEHHLFSFPFFESSHGCLHVDSSDQKKNRSCISVLASDRRGGEAQVVLEPYIPLIFGPVGSWWQSVCDSEQCHERD